MTAKGRLRSRSSRTVSPGRKGSPPMLRLATQLPSLIRTLSPGPLPSASANFAFITQTPFGVWKKLSSSQPSVHTTGSRTSSSSRFTKKVVAGMSLFSSMLTVSMIPHSLKTLSLPSSQVRRISLQARGSSRRKVSRRAVFAASVSSSLTDSSVWCAASR